MNDRWSTLVAEWVTILVTPIGLLLAVVAALYAGFQFHQARQATSAAAVMSLVQALSAAWDAHLKAKGAERLSAFANVLNLLETACAIQRDGIFAGRSGKLLQDFLDDQLEVIDRRSEELGFAEKLRRHPDDFEHILAFMRRKHST